MKVAWDRVLAYVVLPLVFWWSVGWFTLRAFAQGDLPCGPATERSYSFRWIESPDPVTGYRLHVGRAPGAYTEAREMHGMVVDAEGKIVGLDGAFPDDVTWYVALTAWNEHGESPPSNEIVIPARVRPGSDPECQPPGPPSDLELLKERVQALERRMDAIHEASSP